MAEQVQKIEGISPGMLWTFMVVLVGLMALVVLGDKVMDVYRNAKKRRKDRNQLEGQDITDKIADKVIEKLTPTLDERFEEISKNFEDIDKKLAADKALLESHTTQLNDHEGRVSKLEGGNLALCHGMLALLEKDPTLTKEQRAMKNFLIDGKYNEEDWK